MSGKPPAWKGTGGCRNAHEVPGCKTVRSHSDQEIADAGDPCATSVGPHLLDEPAWQVQARGLWTRQKAPEHLPETGYSLVLVLPLEADAVVAVSVGVCFKIALVRLVSCIEFCGWKDCRGDLLIGRV